MDDQNEITESLADQMVKRITKGKQILDNAEESLIKAIIINGLDLAEWKQKLTVNIPEGDDTAALEVACMDLARAVQEAEYILAVFDLKSRATTNFYEKGFARKYVETMKTSGNKKISAEKLRQLVLVDSSVDASLGAAQSAEMITEFFKRIVKGLEKTQKALEVRQRLLYARLKFLNDQ